MEPVARTRFPRHAAIRLGACLLLVVSCATALGCRYFRPSQPEAPRSGGLTPRYTAPETTLVTLDFAVEDKSGTNGLLAYAGCFADTSTDGVAYHAFFDPITTARFPGRSTEWDSAREQIYYANLSRLQPGSTFLFSWSEFPGAPDDVVQPTSAVLYRGYQIQATADDISYVPIARGLADIHMRLVGANWKIVRWQDYEDSRAALDRGEYSFGHLRLAGP